MSDTYDESWGQVIALDPHAGLSDRQRELRDATGDLGGPGDITRERRAARIDALERELGDVRIVRGELDKYRAHAIKADCLAVVRQQMDVVVGSVMTRTDARILRLQADLTTLRRSVES